MIAITELFNSASFSTISGTTTSTDKEGGNPVKTSAVWPAFGIHRQAPDILGPKALFIFLREVSINEELVQLSSTASISAPPIPIDSKFLMWTTSTESVHQAETLAILAQLAVLGH